MGKIRDIIFRSKDAITVYNLVVQDSGHTHSTNNITLGAVNYTPFIVEFTTSTANQVITLPLYNLGVNYAVVDWGDTSSTEITSWDDADKSHTYANAGVHQVSINGVLESWNFYYGGGSKDNLTKIIQWGSFRFAEMYGTFRQCGALTSLGAGSIMATDLYADNTFDGCGQITAIPSSILNGTKFISLSYTFANMYALVTIPANLFQLQTDCNNFYGIFSGCNNILTIPVDLFRYNVLVTNFNYAFSYCTKLTTVPADTFLYNVNAQSFSGTFRGSKMTTIPTDLFRYNVGALDFSYAFMDCTYLTSLPAGIFTYNVNVLSFLYTFNGCTELTTIPDDLFRYNVLVTNFSNVFKNNYSLQLKANIFYATGEESTRFLNKSVNFSSAFNRGSFYGIQGVAPDLWNCTFGTGTPTKTQCFYGAGNDATSISNYASIPTEWK